MTNVESKNRDKLTGLLDYQAFQGAFAEQIAEAEKGKGCVSLGFIDVDWFKKLNDEYGAQVGDEVLKTLAKHLADSTPERSTVFRYGGEHFAVLLPGVEKEQAFLALEQTRSEFDKEHELTIGKRRTKLSVSFSVGIASYPDDGDKGQDIIRKATDAVYRAKATGRNKVSLAREERMVTKTSHYTQGQLARLSQLAEREGVGEAILLREGLDDLFRKYAL